MDDTAPAPPTPRRFVPLALIAAALVAASWACSASLEGRSPELAGTRTGQGVPISVPADRIIEPQDTVEAPEPSGDIPSAEASAVVPPSTVEAAVAGPPSALTGHAGPDDVAAGDQRHASAHDPSANANSNAHGPGGASEGHASPSSKR